MSRRYAAYHGVPVPCVDADEMRTVDRWMNETCGVSLGQMAESTGLALATLALRMSGRDTKRPLIVLAGAGGNGAGALVAARRLAAWGRNVEVVLSRTELEEPNRSLAATLGAMAVPVIVPSGIAGAALSERMRASSLVVDGLVGYGLQGNPRAGVAKLIRLSRAALHVLALDVPSGLDATTGEVRDMAVRADATLTVALPKTGLVMPAARQHVGRLYLVDIGIPRQAFIRLGIAVPQLFGGRALLRLTTASEDFQIGGHADDDAVPV